MGGDQALMCPPLSHGPRQGPDRVWVSDNLSSACSRRAPVLVALALIESGMRYEDAIQFIRQ